MTIYIYILSERDLKTTIILNVLFVIQIYNKSNVLMVLLFIDSKTT